MSCAVPIPGDKQQLQQKREEKDRSTSGPFAFLGEVQGLSGVAYQLVELVLCGLLRGAAGILHVVQPAQRAPDLVGSA